MNGRKRMISFLLYRPDNLATVTVTVSHSPRYHIARRMHCPIGF